MAGFWTAPQSHATRTHLDGTWTSGGNTFTLRRDILYGEYEALSPSSIHMRFFSVDVNNALLSEEYMMAGTWTGAANTNTVSVNRSTPVSVRLGGHWSRVDANGATPATASKATFGNFSCIDYCNNHFRTITLESCKVG